MLKRVAYVNGSQPPHLALPSENKEVYPTFNVPVEDVREVWLVKGKFTKRM